MKGFLSTCLILFSFCSFGQMNNFIESSKAWIDLDYVGDGIMGHKLDVFLPKTGNGPFPAIITIYGSAFFSNSSKANCFQNDYGQSFLRAGYAVISINHRSSKEAIWPAQIHDVKAAIRFVRANASLFHLNQDFLAISGFSSGGHLSAIAGTTSGIKKTSIGELEIDLEGSLGKYPETSSHVDAVINFFGPTDFLIMDSCGSSFSHDDADSPESSLIGGPIQKNKPKTRLANPAEYVQKANPPMLLFHGDKDELVPYCQSEVLYQKQQTAGASSTMVIVPGGGHGPGVMIEKYYTQMISFLNRVKNEK